MKDRALERDRPNQRKVLPRFPLSCLYLLRGSFLAVICLCFRFWLRSCGLLLALARDLFLRLVWVYFASVPAVSCLYLRGSFLAVVCLYFLFFVLTVFFCRRPLSFGGSPLEAYPRTSAETNHLRSDGFCAYLLRGSFKRHLPGLGCPILATKPFEDVCSDWRRGTSDCPSAT